MNKFYKKLSENELINIIKLSFTSLMPFTIVSSIFVLILNFPISPVKTYFKANYPMLWNEILPSVPNAFNNFISLYILIAISYSYGLIKKKNPLIYILGSIFTFFIFSPPIDSSLLINSFGTSGIFFSMLCSSITCSLLNIFSNRKKPIQNKHNIPKEVQQSFSSITPVVMTSLLLVVVKLILTLIGIQNLSDAINSLLQTPITQLGTTLPAILLINFGITLLWFFGFNGSYIFNSIMNPIYFSLNLENMNNVLKGAPPTHIITGSFQSLFIQFGGSGSTLALILAILIFSRDPAKRKIGKLALIPSLFNINEPIVYGFPIILNFKVLIPFLLCPLFNTIVTYYSMAWGIVEKTNGIQIPWTTPPVISGFLASGISGSLLQIVLILANTAIYSLFIINLKYKSESIRKVNYI